MRNITGFTLIELVITLGIVAIIATISTEIYLTQVQKGRRADAMDTLSSIALAEERYRSSNTTYGTLAQVWGGVTTTPGGYYTMAISAVNGTGYTITATAVGNQTNDAENGTACNSLVFAVSNAAITKTPSVCWPQ